MSGLINSLDQFPMEKLLLSEAILVIGLVEFIFFPININWFQRVCKYFSRSFSSIQYQSGKLSDIFRHKAGTVKQEDLELMKRNPLLSGQVDDPSLGTKDVEMVLGKLDKTKGFKRGEYFSSMFEENEPGLDEVKEAFDVFDLNGDGFIHAVELQRVLCGLGVCDRYGIENCKQMIRGFDENRDGRIDFREFVKLMENSFG